LALYKFIYLLTYLLTYLLISHVANAQTFLLFTRQSAGEITVTCTN